MVEQYIPFQITSDNIAEMFALGIPVGVIAIFISSLFGFAIQKLLKISMGR